MGQGPVVLIFCGASPLGRHGSHPSMDRPSHPCLPCRTRSSGNRTTPPPGEWRCPARRTTGPRRAPATATGSTGWASAVRRGPAATGTLPTDERVACPFCHAPLRLVLDAECIDSLSLPSGLLPSFFSCNVRTWVIYWRMQKARCGAGKVNEWSNRPQSWWCRAL